MAERATLARPYAKAAFAYAREHNALAAWSKALHIAGAIVSDPRAAALLTSPKMSSEELLDLLLANDAAQPGDGQFAEHLTNFARLLIKNRRLQLLPEIAVQYEALSAAVENTVDVNVTSAVALTPDQLTKLSAALKTRLKRDIKIETAVEPELLGGAVIRAGDLVIDGSLKGRLEQLRTELSH